MVELHLVEDSSVTQRFCYECLAKMLQVTFDQTIVDASQLVYRSDALVDEGAIEFQAQVVFGKPCGDLSVLVAPEKLVGRRNLSHCAVVLMSELGNGQGCAQIVENEVRFGQEVSCLQARCEGGKSSKAA
jgi:hypothetical protein